MAPTSPSRGTTAGFTKLNIRTVGKVPKTANEASQNWNSLKGLVNDRPAPSRSPRHRNAMLVPTEKSRTFGNQVTLSSTTSTSKPVSEKVTFPVYDAAGTLLSPPIDPARAKPTWCLALDCEMVGVGPMKESALARVSIVNEHGVCVLDKFVKPKAKITDYRTAVSGIREADMANAANFDEVITEVAELLKAHVVVGHAVHHDFKALMFQHPRAKVRDTSIFFRTVFKRTPALKALALKFLNIQIQSGEHSSIQDAQATMQLYLMHRKEWEDKHNAVRQRRKRVLPVSE